MSSRVMNFLSPQAALLGGLLCLGSAVARAQTLAIVGGNPALMRIQTATAGQPPNSITNALTSYRTRTNNVTNPRKITGRLNTAMPAGMTLTINLAPTTGATSFGTVTLDATARVLVGNITNTTNQTRTITYVLSATPAAGVVTLRSRIVTFTNTAWP